jgi:hypothetical protein
MEIIARVCDMPSVRAASSWPFGTAWMPARIVSAMYAAAVRPRPMVTEPYTPPGISRSGKASGTP